MNTDIAGNSPKYRVVCYMRIDCQFEEIEPMTLEDAEAEIESQRLMQPEHIFKIEEVVELDVQKESRPSYTCAGCHPDEPHPDVDYCDNCTRKEPDHQCKGVE